MRKPKKEIQLTSYDDLLGISDMASDKNDSDQMIEVALEVCMHSGIILIRCWTMIRWKKR